MIDNKAMAEALDRIARTQDGQLLYRYCQKQLCSIVTQDPADISLSALRHHEGRRIFAAELMGHMAKGIEDSDRHAITFSVAGARRTDTRPRGAGRRVTADTPVAGWDIPESDAADGKPS